MAENVTLKIWTPEKTVMNKKVYRVVLPYADTNLTVIEDRAPTSLVINPGVLQILDEKDQAVARYFIDSGVADIAGNVCKVSTRHFVEYSQISVENALELKQQEPENTTFYDMIIHQLQAFS